MGQKPFSSGQPLWAPWKTLQIPLSLSQTTFPRVESETSGSLNSVIALLQQNSWSWCLRGGTPRKGIPGLLHSDSLCTRWSQVSHLSHRLLLCLCVSGHLPRTRVPCLSWCKTSSAPCWGCLNFPPPSQPAACTAATRTKRIPQYLLQILSWGFVFQILQLPRSNAACSILTARTLNGSRGSSDHAVTPKNPAGFRPTNKNKQVL